MEKDGNCIDSIILDGINYDEYEKIVKILEKKYNELEWKIEIYEFEYNQR